MASSSNAQDVSIRLSRLPGLAPPAASHEACGGAAEPMRFEGFPITETHAFPPAAQAQCWVYVTLNAEIALSLPRNPALQALTQSPRVRVSVDGQWIWWALRRKYPGRTLDKLSGSDLIYDLAAHCQREQRRMFLLGASATSNATAVQTLQQRFPGLQVGGYAMPHFVPGQDSERAMREQSLAAIRAYEPHYVVLALGPAKQYGVAWSLAAELDGMVSGLMCFGGAIDMVSGTVRRAPAVWRHLGLEGIFRVLQQPSRLGRFLRVLRVLPKLALKAY